MNLLKTFTMCTVTAVAIVSLTGCGSKKNEEAAGGSMSGGTSNSGLSGEFLIDGSSTVYPASQAVAEEFTNVNKGVKIKVGISGTGGGFKKFAKKECEISNASRPIEQGEIEACKAAGVDFFEVPVAFDGLTVVINKENTWATDLTVDELKKIWMLGSTVKSWKDVRPGFPDVPMRFYGAGTDSGTFDYFTKAICGQEKEIRADYSGSEDDNATVQGVSGDKGAIGFFGYTYYAENREKLTAISINGVAPSEETINNGTYTPLSRPEFIYVEAKAYERPEIKEFVNFYISSEGTAIIKDAGFIPLPTETYDLVRERLASGKTGSVFGGKIQVGAKLADLLK